MHAIADTGFLVALVRQNDRHHDWAAALVGQFNKPFLTCEAVLAESAFHLQSSSRVLALVSDGLVQVSFDCSTQIEALRDLAIRYADRNPDLADLCLIRMSELYPKHAVITVDQADFRVYRRNKREVIPMICPPHR